MSSSSSPKPPSYVVPKVLARLFGVGSIYLERRVAVFLFFGFASGLPLGLIGETFRIRLTDAGVDFGTIGLTSLIGTAYAIKFLWAPFVDHIRLGPLTRRLGQRRGWMALTLVLMLALLFGLSVVDPASALMPSILLAVGVAFASATFDIVVDAYRIEYLDDRQLAGGTAVHATAWYLGAKLAAGVLVLWLADVASWESAYLFASLTLVLGLLAVAFNHEPERRVEAELEARQHEVARFLATRPRLAGGRRGHGLATLYVMVAAPFVDLVRRFGWALLSVMAFVVLFKFQDAFAGALSGPFVRDLGYQKSTIAFVYKGFGLVAVFAGMFAGGLLMHAFGLVRALWIAGVLQVVSNLGFSWLDWMAGFATLGVETAFGQGNIPSELKGALIDAHWPWLAGVIGFENFASGMGNTIFVVFLSRLVNDAYTATQYALLSATALVARTFLAAPAGFLAEAVGWFDFFILSGIAGIPGLILLWFLARTRKWD
jgi:PAT family beta-lactamase induction signal transducer AmpG